MAQYKLAKKIPKIPYKESHSVKLQIQHPIFYTDNTIQHNFKLEFGKKQSIFNWEWVLLQDPYAKDIMPSAKVTRGKEVTSNSFA